MTRRTTTQISIQTRRAVVVRALPETFLTYCGQCLDVVVALTPESVSAFLQISIDTVQEYLVSGHFHAVEVGAARPLICCNWLSVGTTNTQIQIEGENQ